MDRDTLIERMRYAHKPGEPISIIERCADVAMDVIDNLERDNGGLRLNLSNFEVAVNWWRQRAEVAEKKLADRERDDTATAHEEDSAELADVIAILDELDAPRVLDTRTLTPAERLGLYLDQRAERLATYLDQRAEQRRETAVDEVARLRERVEWANGALLRATQAHDADRAELEQVRSERVRLRAKLDAVNAALDNAEVPQTVPVEGALYGSATAAARVRWLDKARLTAVYSTEDPAKAEVTRLREVVAKLEERVQAHQEDDQAHAAEVEKLNRDIGGLREQLEKLRSSRDEEVAALYKQLRANGTERAEAMLSQRRALAFRLEMDPILRGRAAAHFARHGSGRVAAVIASAVEVTPDASGALAEALLEPMLVVTPKDRGW